jgi:N6-adenosine-specific RNA methylase IME4
VKLIEGGPFEGLRAKGYGAIVADPPWAFRSFAPAEDPNAARGAERHYSTMTAADIAALPVRQLAHKDCHLFLWTTGPHLPTALHVMKRWGFKYSGIGFTWVKLKRSSVQLSFIPTAEADLHCGLGYTTRKNAEFCILGRRGNCKRAAKDVREVILSPVREHSRKPEEFRRRVDRYVGPDVKVIELFARSGRLGWAAWGNEVDRFENRESANEILHGRGSRADQETLAGRL